ncbi:ATP synthase F1 subunit epsilon [Pelagibacteraceae bacterium]|nr:ATP synthase F1 subunit epsilon [Pelagibacteraceae bacterium]|tara:strand:- start:652 stop:1047 length:396 start_codon:yes stop_codon:yes gene_type:complete
MEDVFKVEIISPENIVYTGDAAMTTMPSYEGDMSILKGHIPLITFLRPGIIKVKKNDNNFQDFFIEEGTVEFYDNSLVILSASAKNTKDLSKDFIDSLTKETEKKLDQKNITDQDRYILNHKLDAIKELRV